MQNDFKFHDIIISKLAANLFRRVAYAACQHIDLRSRQWAGPNPFGKLGYCTHRSFRKAPARHLPAERIATQANSPLRVASHLSRQADLFAATSRPEQAVDLYRKSLSLRREHGAEISRPDAQLQIALVALLKELGRIDEARATLRTAQEYAEQSNLAG